MVQDADTSISVNATKVELNNIDAEETKPLAKQEKDTNNHVCRDDCLRSNKSKTVLLVTCLG